MFFENEHPIFSCVRVNIRDVITLEIWIKIPRALQNDSKNSLFEASFFIAQSIRNVFCSRKVAGM